MDVKKFVEKNQGKKVRFSYKGRKWNGILCGYSTGLSSDCIVGVSDNNPRGWMLPLRQDTILISSERYLYIDKVDLCLNEGNWFQRLLNYF